MFFPLTELIILAIGCVFLALWLIIFLASRKYDSLFAGLDEEEYRLKDLYSTGYMVMEILKYDYKTKRDRKFRQELEVLYEKKYVEFYLRLTYARAVTYAMLLFLLGFPLFGVSGEPILLLIMLLYSVVAVYYFLTLSSKQIEKRSAEILRDFSEVVSKLALLTNAGMILREAWELVSTAGEGPFYDEMQRAVIDMQNGISEIEAVRRFGIRCMIPEVKKFSSTVIQGIQKGNSELSILLQEQSSEVWGLRKQHIRREGEKAASKLLIPILIMFIGILIMVVVPIFTNMGV